MGGWRPPCRALLHRIPNGECARSDSPHKTARRGCGGSRIAKAKPAVPITIAAGLGDMRGGVKPPISAKWYVGGFSGSKGKPRRGG